MRNWPGVLKSNGLVDVAMMVRRWNNTLSGRYFDDTCDTRGLPFISESNLKAFEADMAECAARASSLAQMRASDPHGMQGRVYMQAPNQPLPNALPNFTSTHPLAPAPPVCQPTPQAPLEHRNPGRRQGGREDVRGVQRGRLPRGAVVARASKPVCLRQG
jgi:hypothetical protein